MGNARKPAGRNRPAGFSSRHRRKGRGRRLSRIVWRIVAILLLVFLMLAAALDAGMVPPALARRLPPFLRQLAPPELPASGAAAGFAAFDPSGLPAFSGRPYTEVNGDVPFFSEADLTTEPFERYGKRDALMRCTAAFACIGPETLPSRARGEIREIRPTGWKVIPDETIEGGFLYNRCHLIGFQLSGQDANAQNLITGTRFLNTEGMQPFENSVADYVRNTGRHVLYRVTPVFEGDNLVASGVLMEARSVEDPSVSFCIYCYNEQPGYRIDRKTGEASKIS